MSKKGNPCPPERKNPHNPNGHSETKLIIDNNYQAYRRKQWMFLRLWELEKKGVYDREKSLKMFSYLTNDIGRKHKTSMNDRKKANRELREEFEAGDWKEEAKGIHKERYATIAKRPVKGKTSFDFARNKEEKKRITKRLKKEGRKYKTKKLNGQYTITSWKETEAEQRPTPQRRISR